MEVPQHFTLKQVAESIRKTIAERYSRTYWVTAEMHKLNPTRKGHCYPELVQKENDQIVVEMRGTIWKQQIDRIQLRFAEIVKEPLRDGMELLFHVRITYHPIYNLGLEIIDIDPNYTLGALHRERQATLERLQAEGILNNNQQVAMALLPKRLAIISQADSKGYSDFVTLLNNHPKGYHFDTLLFEATLQGDAAISSIQNQLKRIARVKDHFDAVVIIRGGGGEIGMHCYNNYDLAKSIATYPLPVLTGIGHSTNMTVCEMISFRNGITPSDMAYFLLGIFEELDAPLDQWIQQLPYWANEQLHKKKQQQQLVIRDVERHFTSIVAQHQRKFNEQLNNFQHTTRLFLQKNKDQLVDNRNDLRFSSEKQIRSQQEQHFRFLTQLQHAGQQVMQQARVEYKQQASKLALVTPLLLRQKETSLDHFAMQLKLIDPAEVLARGYAIVTNEHGVLSKTNAAKKGDLLHIQTAHQHLVTQVDKTT